MDSSRHEWAPPIKREVCAGLSRKRANKLEGIVRRCGFFSYLSLLGMDDRNYAVVWGKWRTRDDK